MWVASAHLSGSAEFCCLSNDMSEYTACTYLDTFWPERKRGLSVQYYRLLLPLASGAVGVQSDFPRQCCGTGRHCQNTASYRWLLLGCSSSGRFWRCHNKKDGPWFKNVSTSKLRYFVLFLYDCSLYWNSFELYMLPTAKLKCSCSYLFVSTHDLYLLCLQFPFPSCHRGREGESEWAPCALECFCENAKLGNIGVLPVEFFLSCGGTTVSKKSQKLEEKSGCWLLLKQNVGKGGVAWLGFYPSCWIHKKMLKAEVM